MPADGAKPDFYNIDLSKYVSGDKVLDLVRNAAQKIGWGYQQIPSPGPFFGLDYGVDVFDTYEKKSLIGIFAENTGGGASIFYDCISPSHNYGRIKVWPYNGDQKKFDGFVASLKDTIKEAGILGSS